MCALRTGYLVLCKSFEVKAGNKSYFFDRFPPMTIKDMFFLEKVKGLICLDERVFISRFVSDLQARVREQTSCDLGGGARAVQTDKTVYQRQMKGIGLKD